MTATAAPLTAAQTATYHRARIAGMPAGQAVLLARWAPEPMPATLDGFDLRMTDEPDEYDPGDMGYGRFLAGAGDDWRTGYPRKPDPDAIRNANGSYRDGTAWYVPAVTIRESAAYFRKAGEAKGPAWEHARAMAEDELSRLADSWGPDVRIVTVTASRAGIRLGSASCGGVEIAWDPIRRTSGEEYLWEVARDLMAEAVAEAQDALARLVAA